MSRAGVNQSYLLHRTVCRGRHRWTHFGELSRRPRRLHGPDLAALPFTRHSAFSFNCGPAWITTQPPHRSSHDRLVYIFNVSYTRTAQNRKNTLFSRERGKGDTVYAATKTIEFTQSYLKLYF